MSETYPPTVWSDACAPGGMVCAVPNPRSLDGICGYPVESEPCPEHPAVPAELLRVGLVEGHNDGRESLDDFELDYDHVQFLEDALAAVLPAHEALVRAKVAEEIEAYAQKLMDAAVEQVKDGGEAGFSALLRAAAIKSTAGLARGEQPSFWSDLGQRARLEVTPVPDAPEAVS